MDTQLLHSRLMGFYQARDIFIGVDGAHEAMVVRDVQAIQAVQQPQPWAGKAVAMVGIAHAVDRTGGSMHPKHGANARGNAGKALLLGKVVDLSYGSGRPWHSDGYRAAVRWIGA